MEVAQHAQHGHEDKMRLRKRRSDTIMNIILYHCSLCTVSCKPSMCCSFLSYLVWVHQPICMQPGHVITHTQMQVQYPSCTKSCNNYECCHQCHRINTVTSLLWVRLCGTCNSKGGKPNCASHLISVMQPLVLTVIFMARLGNKQSGNAFSLLW